VKINETTKGILSAKILCCYIVSWNTTCNIFGVSSHNPEGPLPYSSSEQGRDIAMSVIKFSKWAVGTINSDMGRFFGIIKTRVTNITE
jgi:hypothetical protein